MEKIRQRQIIYQDNQYKLYNNTIVNTIAVKQSEHTHCIGEHYCYEAQLISLHCN